MGVRDERVACLSVRMDQGGFGYGYMDQPAWERSSTERWQLGLNLSIRYE